MTTIKATKPKPTAATPPKLTIVKIVRNPVTQEIVAAMADLMRILKVGI